MQWDPRLCRQSIVFLSALTTSLCTYLQNGTKKVSKAVFFRAGPFWMVLQIVSASPLKKHLMCRWFIFKADVSRMHNHRHPIFGSALCVAACDAERCLMAADFHLHIPQRRRHRRKIDSLSHKWACCTKSTWTHSALLTAEFMLCFHMVWSRQTTIILCFFSTKPGIGTFQIKKEHIQYRKVWIFPANWFVQVVKIVKLPLVKDCSQVKNKVVAKASYP